MPPRHSLRGAPSEALLLEDVVKDGMSGWRSLNMDSRYPLMGRLVLPKVGRLIESVNSLMT
ncbi:uncharacterized protein BBA_03739 [Beauveria bassiana ARSEF 2860]|uniref:Uncharacterized protein n=1 Tax=Beauveria bassiana (strain ARSEF 2860) TaxID=655819 RepID=J4WAI8_BEAB2|nr:uncharacterized protein BBA_03739 [Beauveria bassiana ARSEF 2860]EJP67165.1 hypothetical protein BBA_03739 [Beauveria bassiana ARSEF 2860]